MKAAKDLEERAKAVSQVVGAQQAAARGRKQAAKELAEKGEKGDKKRRIG